MIAYRTNKNSMVVKVREVEKFTDMFVVFKPTTYSPRGQREAIAGEYQRWFRTLDEAKKYLIARHKDRIKEAEAELRMLNSQQIEVREWKEGDWG